jgi:hypothetical protein
MGDLRELTRRQAEKNATRPKLRPVLRAAEPAVANVGALFRCR